jgi:hypothetical protein
MGDVDVLSVYDAHRVSKLVSLLEALDAERAVVLHKNPS